MSTTCTRFSIILFYSKISSISLQVIFLEKMTLLTVFFPLIHAFWENVTPGLQSCSAKLNINYKLLIFNTILRLSTLLSPTSCIPCWCSYIFPFYMIYLGICFYFELIMILTFWMVKYHTLSLNDVIILFSDLQ